MNGGTAHGGARVSAPSATASYLESRVREEASAAALAPSLEATMIHLALATAYARQFGECGLRAGDREWIDQHRVW